MKINTDKLDEREKHSQIPVCVRLPSGSSRTSPREPEEEFPRSPGSGPRTIIIGKSDEAQSEKSSQFISLGELALFPHALRVRAISES